MNHYDVIVIGAGQAGLAASYFLKKKGVKFLILEAASRTGSSWLKRYDSLKLFTYSRYNNLPGLEFPGEKDRFPTKDEVAAYLQFYAEYFELPIVPKSKVDLLVPAMKGFVVNTRDLTYECDNVVVATGPFQTPFIPLFSNSIDLSIRQFHSSEYKNPAQLDVGDTLVVGAGNSGVQIVEELVEAKRKVFFSFSGDLKRFPNNGITQRLIFGSGLTCLSKTSAVGSMIYKRGEPIMGTNITKLFAAPNLQIVGRATEAQGMEIHCEGKVLNTISNIIWSTGFRPDFSWIKSDIFDGKGFPVQRRGVTDIEGLYFLGLSWMHSRNSGLLGGARDDAEFVVKHLLHRMPAKLNYSERLFNQQKSS